MNHTLISVIGATGVITLASQPDPQFWVTVGVLITSLYGIVSSRMQSQREKQRHEWELADRVAYRESMKAGLEKNTALTQEAKELNVIAIETANHVNEKLARIATGRVEIAVDTNATAHRIESKL